MSTGKRYNQAQVLVAWTESDKIKARGMIAKGMTARDIGKALGRSRNSVIGWMHRQKIASSVLVRTPKPKIEKETKPKPPRKKKVRPLQSAKIPSFHHFTNDDERRYEPYQPLVFDNPAPTMRLIDTVGHMQCRWIPDRPKLDETLVCGRETDGRSYCPLHHGIVYPRKVMKPKRIEANAP